jgi:hypothetical protein
MVRTLLSTPSFSHFDAFLPTHQLSTPVCEESTVSSSPVDKGEKGDSYGGIGVPRDGAGEPRQASPSRPRCAKKVRVKIPQ